MIHHILLAVADPNVVNAATELGTETKDNILSSVSAFVIMIPIVFVIILIITLFTNWTKKLY